MTTVAVFGIATPVGREIASQLDVDPEIERIVAVDATAPPDAPEKLVPLAHAPGRDLGAALRENGVRLAVYLAADACGACVPNGGSDAPTLERFLDAAAAAGAEGIVVASGALVYGPREAPTSLPLYSEGAAIRSDGFAPGEADLARETAIAHFARARPDAAIALARLAPTVGPGTDGLAPRFLGGKRVPALRGFDPEFQFLHVEDAALVVFKLLKARRTGIYNVAPDDAVTPVGIARALGKTVARWPPWLARAVAATAHALGLQGAAGLGPGLLPLLMHPVLLANRKLKRDLGYTFKYASVDAVKDHARQARGPT